MGFCGTRSCGEYSIAVTQANAKPEDQGQVVTSPAASFVGVYDGHGGPEASRFLSSRLFPWHVHGCNQEGIPCHEGGVLAPGDSRAILGRRRSDGQDVVVERLSNDLNVAEEEVRKELTEQHPDDSHIFIYTRGVWRMIKGIIQVSRSIGEFYLKKPKFARDPKFRQCGIAERLVRAALTEAVRKREMRYTHIKHIERGTRWHFHDDITIIVVYLDHQTWSAD
ncbi:hypothetical protein GUJ93_ZPchr0013g35460 [Zizania palustris]|uniref:protein-serine/threonine phosphatase n=1 Tax=Zizania palustris TaxID=103762 RepID=A0A8J5WXS4_ZIZPA|nr:hypothetical protein GUJ93_ZPchr0013g35460 [Zizania palustris]